MRSNRNSFRPVGEPCGINGCQLIPSLYWRSERLQRYWYCSGYGSTPPAPENSHRAPRRTTITKGSFFYCRRALQQEIAAVAYRFFFGTTVIELFNTQAICTNTISQIFRDCQIMMLSDFERHNP